MLRQRRRLQSGAEPERLRMELSSVELAAASENGMVEFQAIAQFFNRVNDRLIVFREGAFGKTIRENVAAGRVIINDAHVHTAAATIGLVVEAEERPVGLWYRGRLSSTAASIATKLREGIIKENSIEFVSIVEGVTRVPLQDVPVGAYLWDQATGDGTVEAREVTEAAWLGIALLPFSSQARSAILEINCAVPFQDLPVTGRARTWDPVAAEARVRAWAGKMANFSQGEGLNTARLQTAYLLRGPIHNGEPEFLGLIADVEQGRLVVVPDAIEAALEALAQDDRLLPADLIAAGRIAARYESKLAAGSRELAPNCPAELGSPKAEDPAGPAPSSPPTDDSRNVQGAPDRAAQRLELAGLELRLLALKPSEVSFESARTGREPTSKGRPGV